MLLIFVLLSVFLYSQLYISPGTVIIIKEDAKIIESFPYKNFIYSNFIFSSSGSTITNVDDIYVETSEKVDDLPKKHTKIVAKTTKREIVDINRQKIRNAQLFFCDSSNSIIDDVGNIYISGVTINFTKANVFLKNALKVQIKNTVTISKEFLVNDVLWYDDNSSSLKFVRPPPSIFFI